MDESVKPAIRMALRLHEIGDATPYRISFAGKGKSGASFGFMQGDMAQGPPIVRQTFVDAMHQAGTDNGTSAAWQRQLSVPLITCPLSGTDRGQVDTALAAGSALVDAMDENLIAKIYADLDTCVTRGGLNGHALAPKALIYIAMWANMTGYPDQILVWLGGGAPSLRHPVAPAADMVDGPAMEAYLLATDYFIENPNNWPQMLSCAAAGAQQLPDA